MPNLNGGLDSDATVVWKYFNKLLFVGCVFVNLITPNASYALGGAESGQNCPAGQVACISMLHQALFVVRPVYNYAQRIVKMWTRVVAKVRVMAATMVTMAMMVAEQQ